MENNHSGSRSTDGAQRSGYPPYNNQRTWSKGNFFENVNPPVKNGDQGLETTAVQKQNTSQKEVKTFRDLAIWQRGISLVKAIYLKTSSFPKDETYGLTTQMRRAAVSIPSNIAEGYRRRHSKEFQQFLNVSLGSLGELETQIVISGELNYLSNENGASLLEEIDHLTRMVISLSKKVDR